MSAPITSSGPCACCNCIEMTLTCSTRGGIASLCGYSEFANPSSPPKKYRTITLSGSLAVTIYMDSGCVTIGCPPSGTGGTGTVVAHGSCSYDSMTCSLTTGTDTVTGTACGSTNHHNYCSVLDQTTGDPGTTTVSDKKTQSVTYDGLCHVFGDGIARKVTGTLSNVLSDEDKPQDAIARLLAGAGGIWSAYVSPALGQCAAAWQFVQEDFTFTYTEARWRLNATGLVPGKQYTTNVQYFRRFYGIELYLNYASDPITATADGSGNLQIDGDVPNDIGYQTYAIAGICQPAAK